MADQELTAVFCPECNAGPYKNNAGLSVHRKNAHGIQGTSPVVVRGRKKKAKEPKVSAKGDGSVAKYEMGKDGKYHCPDCKMTFNGPAAVGRHRRDAHGVPGSSPAAVHARQVQGKEPSEAQPFKCFYCDRTFAGIRWRSKHINLEHPGQPVAVDEVSPQPKQPKALAVRHQHQGVSNGNTPSHVAQEWAPENYEPPAPEIPKQFLPSVAMAVGQFQQLATTIAYADNIPARDFASWCAAYFLRATLR